MRAVIVVGGESSKDSECGFLSRAFKLDLTLISDFGMLCDRKFDFLAYPQSDIIDKLQNIFIESRTEDILLFYIGHGQENGWPLGGIHDLDLIEYETLALTFAGHQGNLIFVNDCCFAGAAKKSMNHRFGDYDHLLIAAMPENKKGYAHNFLNYLLNDWLNGRSFFPGQSLDNERKFFPVVYGNKDLQKLVFPKIKSAAF